MEHGLPRDLTEQGKSVAACVFMALDDQRIEFLGSAAVKLRQAQ